MTVTPPPSPLDDDELHRLAVQGNDVAGRSRAASELLGRYRAQTLRWCLRYEPDPEAARDLAQEVLLRAYRGLASYQGRSSFRSWLFVVCRNTVFNALRRRSSPPPTDIDPDLLPATTPDPERQLLERMHVETVLTIIRENLDPEEQTALWLRCFEQMSVAAIADVLGCTTADGARVVLQRARRKLRSALATHDDRGGER